MTLWVSDKIHTEGIRLENTPALEVDLAEGITVLVPWHFASFRGRVKQKTAWPC